MYRNCLTIAQLQSTSIIKWKSCGCEIAYEQRHRGNDQGKVQKIGCFLHSLEVCGKKKLGVFEFRAWTTVCHVFACRKQLTRLKTKRTNRAVHYILNINYSMFIHRRSIYSNNKTNKQVSFYNKRKLKKHTVW